MDHKFNYSASRTLKNDPKFNKGNKHAVEETIKETEEQQNFKFKFENGWRWDASWFPLCVAEDLKLKFWLEAAPTDCFLKMFGSAGF